MKKTDFIKLLDSYPDDADIVVSKLVDDGDGGYNTLTDVEIDYYDKDANWVVLS